MRHHKIQKSNKHKKLKVVSASNWSDDEEEDNQQPKRDHNQHVGNPSKFKVKNLKEKRTKEKDKLIQKTPRRLKELFEPSSSSGNSSKSRKKTSNNKLKNNPGLLSGLNEIDSSDGEPNSDMKVPIEDEDGAVRGIKLRPESIKQGPYETNGQFMRRLNKLAASAKFEAVIEERFNVDLCPKGQKGLPRKPQILSTVDGSVYDESKDNKRRKSQSIKSGTNPDESISNKVLKRRVRDHKRRMKKKGIKRPISGMATSDPMDSDGPDFGDYTDHVTFGEVVQRPPSLSKFKRFKK